MDRCLCRHPLASSVGHTTHIGIVNRTGVKLVVVVCKMNDWFFYTRTNAMQENI